MRRKRLNTRPPTGAIIPPHLSFSSGLYRKVNGRYRRATDRRVISAALTVLAESVAGGPPIVTTLVRDYLAIRLGGLEYEVFCCLYLDAGLRVIECENLFRGSINAAAIFPREIAKQALVYNADALLVAHNHPSGLSEPSAADKLTTMRLKHTLDLIDVRLVDHVIVGAGEACSMAELGLL